MLTALTARKEALLEKLKERTEELKALCVQEAVGSDKHTTSPHNFHTYYRNHVVRIGHQLEDFLLVDLITIDYHKTKTNIITTANERKGKYYQRPMRTWM